MLDDFVRVYGNWMLLIVFMGSVVDLFQFSWILKRMYRGYKMRQFNRIKKKVLESQYELVEKR